MALRAVAFDMDGVLIDSEKVYRMCWLKNGLSIGIPENEMSKICDRMAGGTKKTNAHVMKEKWAKILTILHSDNAQWIWSKHI